ncbi:MULTISPECIES: APC family permease [Burkholderia]|jgi:amino acid transporter|uniref:Amino acid permease n=2 Tax=Burkholderia contaminans TaxID=488447 RepID=A0A1E3FIB2_9BURK|nr:MULTISPECIES: amino acid permease [Burkholderia]UTP24290.1 amino acid permease [Burkholderia sp. FXe9]HBN6128625.1 amino acid permease [Clostridioides difficile]KKL31867.1 amino acid permease [Burkholderia contaminans LMG 23361]MBA9830138.1 amino acid permease [Burkholderia contaminans]MBA9839679.1 amino acid permease [Burkholderia contaminans]
MSFSDPRSADDDSAQLAALGYTSSFDRSMGLWQNFALGFTYLSPVVGAYTLFTFGMTTGGPPFIWSYLIAAIGQMFVCLIFGEVVSQFPIAGGLYPWTRRLVGARWAWMSGWVYMWALITTVAAVPVGGAPFFAYLLGFDVTPKTTTIIAIVLLLGSTLINLLGTKTLARIAMFGFICEVLGALLVSGYLLLFGRLQPLHVIFETFSFSAGGSYLPAFLAAALVGMFCCYGFEACGDLAEETPNPGKAIPRAMRMTIYIGIPVTIYACLGLILAVPDLQAAISGKDADPINTILTHAFGSIGARVVYGIVLISHVSCILSLQAAVSRLVYAYARDKMIICSGFLSRISPRTHVPAAALVVAGVVSAFIDCIGFFVQDALNIIVSFAAVGIYVAFQMVVLGAMFARVRGWRPAGQFSMGNLGWLVNILALAYGIGAVVNILWPRTPTAPWYMNYSMLLTLVVVVISGLLYLFIGKPHRKSDAPAGDAHLLTRQRRFASDGAGSFQEVTVSRNL